jgi:nucleoside-diphosphate-sugar epimerase
MSTQDLILVTGASGKIGSSIAKQLERLGKEFRLFRDPKKLSGFPSAENAGNPSTQFDRRARAEHEKKAGLRRPAFRLRLS